MNAVPPHPRSVSKSAPAGGWLSACFSPEKLPRLLSPYGVLSRRQFFVDSLKLWLVSLLFALILAVLPRYLYEHAFFDDLPDILWLLLQAVYLTVVLLCLAAVLWADLCLYIKRLREAGGHWGIALAVCAGILAFCFVWQNSDDVTFVKVFFFVLFLLLPPRRREAAPARPVGGQGWVQETEEGETPSPPGE